MAASTFSIIFPLSLELRQLTPFSAHFTSNADNGQACNFAAFVPLEERSPLQVKEEITLSMYVTDAGGENVEGTSSNQRYNVSSSDGMENFYGLLCGEKHASYEKDQSLKDKDDAIETSILRKQLKEHSVI
ncbi:hypothetical protein KSP39_PZI004506 [Platanthera zijinensis]|uniref:Uncharacterized protein n=1 Tax=Platanthera zijinensis TaxID=2320716 RepID=A0AAP0BY23_9ASPA